MNSAKRNRLLLVLTGLFMILGCKSCFSPIVEFEKTASPTAFTGPGQVITYSYVVTLPEGLPITFSIVDDMLGEVSCPSNRLEPGSEITCQMTYVTTDEDVAAGVIKNTADLTAISDSLGDMEYEPTESSASAEVVYEEPDCLLELKKTASPTTYIEAGQVISYTYEIHNTGNHNVSGPFSIYDDLVDEWSCDDGGSGFDLCVDCTITCTGTYTVQASDVGSDIINTAHAEGMCQSTNAIAASNPDSAIVKYLVPTATPSSLQPELTVTILADPNVYSTAETLIVYRYSIQNTGQNPVQGPFTIVDDRVDQWACDALDVMPVGGHLNCKGYYLTRESDVGSDIVNSAHAQGSGNAAVSNNASATVYYFQGNSDNGPAEEPGGPAATEPPCEPAWSPSCQ